MARRKSRPVTVRLIESVGHDLEAVARVQQTWAILLADQAQRKVVNELRASEQL